MMPTEPLDLAPIHLASTQSPSPLYQRPLEEHKDQLRLAQDSSRLDGASTYFKSAEWSPDGTTILTDSSDYRMRTYIVPPDLLEEQQSPYQLLAPYSILPSGEPTYASAFYPFYSLQEPSSTLFLSSVRDHPIRLTSALVPTTVASYKLVNPTTEAFITPHCISYPAALGGTHFITGSDSLICLFDVSRPGDGPVTWMPTIPSKRKQLVGGGVGMKGIVSALAVNSDGILAAGTFSRNVGLYDSYGTGQSLGTFNVCRTEAEAQGQIGGGGVTQLLWSPCGRYLYIAERKSDGVLVYDIRVSGQLLGWLQGRGARTNQRMKIDLVSGQDGVHEIWAGGADGVVRQWKNTTEQVGGQEPTWEWKIHEDLLSSTVLHPLGNVMATTCGQKPLGEYSGEKREVKESSLDLWYLPGASESKAGSAWSSPSSQV